MYLQNTPLRNNSLSTGFLKENKTWKEAGKVVSDNIYYSAPIRLHICPDKSTIHTFSNVNNDIDIQLYPNPADAMLNVVIKTSTKPQLFKFTALQDNYFIINQISILRNL